MTAPHEVLQAAEHVLLDFDGPVCAAFNTITDGQIAEALRQYLAQQGWPPSDELRTITDPLDVLAHTVHLSADLAVAVEAELTRWECHAVHYADPTRGVHEVLSWLAKTDRTVTIVSNNAPSAIDTYLHTAGLSSYISGISGRTPDSIRRLKPDPYLLRQAMSAHTATADQSVMIGDSPVDIQAATTLGTASIAYANKPGKTDTLTTCRPTAIITHMLELLPPTPRPDRD